MDIFKFQKNVEFFTKWENLLKKADTESVLYIHAVWPTKGAPSVV